MSKVKYFFVLATILLASPTWSQSVRWQFKSKSIAVNDADTVYFAFRGAGLAFNIDPDTVAINPPDMVYNDDLSVLSIRRTNGTAADSVIAYAKGLDLAGRIVRNDSVMVFGASFAAPGSGNAFGDGGVHIASLAGLVAKHNGVAIICKVFDRVGGTRRFEFGHGIP